MTQNLETRDDWKGMVEAVASTPLAEVAKAHDVAVVDLVASLRRAGVQREAVRSPEAGKVAKKASSKASTKKKGSRRKRRSRVDAFAELVGQVPDRVVAERAGVTIGAVRNWRVARGIPAAGRLALPPEPGEVAEALAAPPAEAKPARMPKRRGRRSRIDPWASEVGTVPDRVIAEKAGVSVNAVANYRKVRGIPGFGTAAAASAAPAASGATAAPAPASSPPAAPAPGLAGDALRADELVRRLHRQLGERYDPAADAALRDALAARDALVLRLGQAALAHLASGGSVPFAG